MPLCQLEVRTLSGHVERESHVRDRERERRSEKERVRDIAIEREKREEVRPKR